MGNSAVNGAFPISTVMPAVTGAIHFPSTSNIARPLFTVTLKVSLSENTVGRALNENAQIQVIINAGTDGDKIAPPAESE